MATYPKQKLSLKEKLKKDSVTGLNNFEQTIDYYISESGYDNDHEEIINLYRYLGDELDEDQYKYVLNPYNTAIDKYKRFGATLRNFNIIRPVVDLYVGEYGERLKEIEVLDVNPEDENRYKEGLDKLLEQYYSQKIINDFIEAGIDVGQDPQAQEALQEQVRKYNTDFDSNRVITGKEVLDYVTFNQDAIDKYTEGYLAWLVSGSVCTYKDVYHNDVGLEFVPEWEVTVPKYWKGTFYEDAPAVTRTRIMQPNEILDKWRGRLSEKTIKWLDEQDSNGIIGNNTGFIRLSTQWISSKEDYKRHSIINEFNGIPVYHVQYKTYQQVGILSYIDQTTGLEETMEVDESYKLNPINGDISIEWEWITEIIEGTRIEEQEYVDVRPLPYNRADLNNSSNQKLSYNGRRMRTPSGEVVSLVKSGKNSQILYNILKYQFEKVVNKNKTKLLVMPQGLIPKGKKGWTEESFFYYSHANDMLFIDETAPNASLAIQSIKAVDMSLGNYLRELYETAMSIKTEWWDNIGMNRQRFGDVKASDGKGVSEQAVYRSAVISAELNRKYEKFEEKDYAGLLDLCKIAYLDGKKAKYINSVGREAFLNINADNAIYLSETSFNVFVKNSIRHQKDLELMKQYAFSVAQNGGKSSMWLEMIGTNSFNKAKNVIAKMEEEEERYRAAQEEKVLENQQAIESSKRESEQLDRDIKVYEADKDYDKIIDAKLLELGRETEGGEGTDEPIEDKSEEVRMNNHKISVDNKNTDLAFRDLLRKERETKMKERKTKAEIKNLGKKSSTN